MRMLNIVFCVVMGQHEEVRSRWVFLIVSSFFSISVYENEMTRGVMNGPE